MQSLLIGVAACLVSLLTFFSGFGLGTLLMPLLALMVPLEQAIAATAVAHLCNNLFKVGVVGRHADRRVLLRFGGTAIAAAFLGAWMLTALGSMEPVYTAEWAGRAVAVTPLKLAAAALIVFFAMAELLPAWRAWSVPSKYMPLGGALSGFFGGLSGHQGAFRSAFLLRAGLSKEAFIGTGVVIASAVDLARLGVYLVLEVGNFAGLDSRTADAPWRWDLLGAACAGAIAGSIAGTRLLKKTTLEGVRAVAAILMILIGAGLAAGAI